MTGKRLVEDEKSDNGQTETPISSCLKVRKARVAEALISLSKILNALKREMHYRIDDRSLKLLVSARVAGPYPASGFSLMKGIID